ncbi:PIN/TRAM domain-containing protein [Candidatus Viridilinea mediisalina]|uniref:Twitching motility protein PilT n=1 Tax=Candidatus Viridilinea mediisalina TaxID=2024553 RepID=A0A2A6REW5_9CHLR|nr:PIN domain-containing protein [Candidatus Viridilinea mediisalina]PDW01372.1 twitching motility protein PilT [Candidatus Viridilinea mediisalina]
MKLSLNLVVRLLGMSGLAYLGWYLGVSLSRPVPTEMERIATNLLMLAGGGLGLLVTPRLTIEPLNELLRRSRSVPLSDLLVIGAGVMLGIIFSVLLTVPLASLPSPLSQILPIVVTLVLAYAGGSIFSSRRHDMGDLLKQLRPATSATTIAGNPELPAPDSAPRRFLVDTSAVIDGRIAAVARTGFLEGTLIVPAFVLAELQQLADSADDLRRAKGRRGLELLSEMQHEAPLPIEVVNVEVAGVTRVDDKLVALARQYNSPIITNDFNLNKVAALQGVKVLSLNILSEAMRPLVIQDQRLQLTIRNEGNARQQGVGYLDDGTPVIVEDARQLIGQSVEVIVTRLHQTQTGRIVFATLAPEELSAPR